ncbi:ABC exporter membrane fusion protein, partial [Nostoc cf. edaphicum LEGE 07299]|nr:ABC exporter membrane fusion protein [Nostoc cf. edaphicum LEGE 07299]
MGGRVVIAVIGGVIVLGSLSAYGLFRSRMVQSNSQTPPVAAPVAQFVTALGRLEPQGEVIKLAGSSQGSRVAQLFVKQGDQVRADQKIAILDSRDRLQAALEQAKRQVRIAQTKLAQVEAGAKDGEINAQKATIIRTQAQLREDVRAKDATVARLEAEVRNAQTEYDRHENLYREGAVSASLRDNKRLALDAAVQQLNEAKATRDQSASTLTAQVNEAQSTLERIAEVRPVDIDAARAEVESAIVAVQQAQADLDLASIKAPRDGQILKVHTWAGEVVSEDGIVELGQTDRMYAIAEVYESDVKHVKLGHTATITSPAFDGEVNGTVSDVGLQIYKKNVLNTDPTAA